MTLYHGSPDGGLRELKPFLSEHGKPYLYFADEPLVALLYAVKPVPKPFSFYPYGFQGGKVVFPNIMKTPLPIFTGESGGICTSAAICRGWSSQPG